MTLRAIGCRQPSRRKQGFIPLLLTCYLHSLLLSCKAFSPRFPVLIPPAANMGCHLIAGNSRCRSQNHIQIDKSPRQLVSELEVNILDGNQESKRAFGEINENENIASQKAVPKKMVPRSKFLKRALHSTSLGMLGLITMVTPMNPVQPSIAFDGGVGGLGKTRPQTGVVFRDADVIANGGAGAAGDDVTNELLAPDGTAAFVTFSAPWPLLKTSTGIESRDIAGGFESAFIQVAELPSATITLESIKPAFLSQIIFSSAGKFGMYGTPTDIKIKKIETSSKSGPMALYLASFTTLTPAMRESDRKAYISASIVGNGLFLLVTSTTASRFNKLEGMLRTVANSFQAIPAPKSSLRGGS